MRPSPSQGDSLDSEELGVSICCLEEIFASEDGLQIFGSGSAYEPTVIDILERLLQGDEFNLERDKLERFHYLFIGLAERIMEQLQRDD